MPPISDEEVQTHPLTIYSNAHKAALAKVELEIAKQQDIVASAADEAAAITAGGEVFKLTAKLGLLAAEHDRFMVTMDVQALGQGPGAKVVAETQALAEKLAAAIKKKNSSKLVLNAVTAYLNGTIAFFNGKVPVVPAPAAVPATAPAPAPGQ